MSDVRVRTLERLFQMAVILGRATESVTKVPGNMTVTPVLASFILTVILIFWEQVNQWSIQLVI